MKLYKNNAWRGVPLEIKDAEGNEADPVKAIEAMSAAMNAKLAELGIEIKKVDGKVDAEVAKGKRPGATETKTDAEAEHKALAIYLRTGNDTELKAMSVGSDPDGGYFVLPSISANMTKRIFDQSAVRRLARVETITTGDLWEEPVDIDEPGAEWVGESQARPATDTAELRMLRIPLREIYAHQVVTQRLMDLADRDVGAWVEGKVGDKFGRSEGEKFIEGDGVATPRGFLTYDTAATDDFTRAWGAIQYVNSGGASTITADGIKDLYWSLRAPYRNGAKWLMASNTANALDKLRTSVTGDYIWRNGMTSGVNPTLLGHEVEFDETMQAVAADAFPIAFANWPMAYVIVDKAEIKFLHDPYSNKPNVVIYGYRRIGGGIANSDAIKLQKVAS